jgi:hypothetical protein
LRRSLLEAELLSEYLVRLRLQFLDRYFASGMRLHVRVKPIELFHAKLARRFRSQGGTEFLKVRTNAV